MKPRELEDLTRQGQEVHSISMGTHPLYVTLSTSSYPVRLYRHPFPFPCQLCICDGPLPQWGHLTLEVSSMLLKLQRQSHGAFNYSFDLFFPTCHLYLLVLWEHHPVWFGHLDLGLHLLANKCPFDGISHQRWVKVIVETTLSLRPCRSWSGGRMMRLLLGTHMCSHDDLSGFPGFVLGILSLLRSPRLRLLNRNWLQLWTHILKLYISHIHMKRCNIVPWEYLIMGKLKILASQKCVVLCRDAAHKEAISIPGINILWRGEIL